MVFGASGILALGAMEAGEIAVVAILLISSLLNVVYLLQIPFLGFLPIESNNTELRTSIIENNSNRIMVQEAPICCLIAIAVTTFGCLILFFYPDLIYDLMKLVIIK